MCSLFHLLYFALLPQRRNKVYIKRLKKHCHYIPVMLKITRSLSRTLLQRSLLTDLCKKIAVVWDGPTIWDLATEMNAHIYSFM